MATIPRRSQSAFSAASPIFGYTPYGYRVGGPIQLHRGGVCRRAFDSHVRVRRRVVSATASPVFELDWAAVLRDLVMSRIQKPLAYGASPRGGTAPSARRDYVCWWIAGTVEQRFELTTISGAEVGQQLFVTGRDCLLGTREQSLAFAGQPSR